MLKTKELSIRYSQHQACIIKQANLSINEGEIVLLLGENGSGKSSLIRTLAALQKPHSGSITLNKKDLYQWPKNDLAKQMALVLTTKQFQGLLKVDEFIAFGRYPFTNWLGKLTEKDKHAVQESIKHCGLEQLQHKALSDLSDGERQKVFLARALAQQAKLLILDEPTTHLDVKNISTQLKLIQHLSKNEGKTILFSSHQFDLALQVADKLWLIEGQRVHQLSPHQFYEDCHYQEILLGDSYRYDKESNRFRVTL